MSRVWPLMQCLADFTAGPPNVPSSVSVDLMAPTAQTSLKTWSTTRGRQYELGTVQTGSLTLDLTDPLEKLNPVNTGSPWNSGGNTLLPYRCVQLGAWLNTATKDLTGNFLNSTNTINASSTRNDPSFESGTSGFYIPTGAPTFATSTAQHFVGAQSLAVTFNASGDSVGLGIRVPQGQTYTLSVYVFVPASHTATLTWTNYPAFSVIGTATSSTTGAWQRLTVTGVPSAVVTTMQISCSAAYPATVYVDAFQLELGGSASAFTTSGPTFFPVYTGYIERYPQAWDMAGFRGRKPLAAVDALSPLSRTIISQSYAATVLADGPSVYIPYNDDAFPFAPQLPSGGQPMTPFQQLGPNSSAVSFGGDQFLDGSKAVVVSQQNTDPLTSGVNTALTVAGTRQGSTAMNPQSFSLEAWIRFSSGLTYFGAAAMQPGETMATKVVGPLSYLGWYSTGGFLASHWDDPVNLQFNLNFTSVNGGQQFFPDGQWHYLSIVFLGSNTFQFILDGQTSSVRTLPNSPPSGVSLNNFYLQTQVYYGDPISTSSFANMAAYGYTLTSAQRLAHYQRGIGYLGEKSGTRALRLLTQYWSTNVVTDTGVTSMAPDFGYNGRAMLDVLQEIADTEFGLVWADTAGTVHQDSRETRYTATMSKTAQFVFGENTAGGELPYETLAYDYDPTYVYSQANFTSAGTGTQLAPVINTTSQTAYGQRILSKTLQTANDWDAGQAANFVVQRYAKPAGAPGTGVPPRITGMTINPGANPNLWAAALSLDIGYRVTVKRRTSAGVTISGDYYIEQVNHSVNGDAATWTVAYQMSPVFVSQPWILGDATNGVLGTTTVCVY